MVIFRKKFFCIIFLASRKLLFVGAFMRCGEKKCIQKLPKGQPEEAKLETEKDL
jgi:hypothetical protein